MISLIFGNFLRHAVHSFAYVLFGWQLLVLTSLIGKRLFKPDFDRSDLFLIVLSTSLAPLAVLHCFARCTE